MHGKSDIRDSLYTIRENSSGGWSVDTYTRESGKVGTRVLCVTKRKETTTPKVGKNEVVENEVVENEMVENEVVKNEVVENDDVVCSCNNRVLSVNVDLLPM